MRARACVHLPLHTFVVHSARAPILRACFLCPLGMRPCAHTMPLCAHEAKRSRAPQEGAALPPPADDEDELIPPRRIPSTQRLSEPGTYGAHTGAQSLPPTPSRLAPLPGSATLGEG